MTRSTFYNFTLYEQWSQTKVFFFLNFTWSWYFVKILCRAAISISNLLGATFKFVFFKIVALKIKISPKNMKKLNFNKLSLKTLINRLHHWRLSEISRNIFRGNSWQLLLCMCMCVYVHSLWKRQLSEAVGMSENRSRMLRWIRFFPQPSLFIATFEWNTKPF